jgi:hypothetical protein
MLPTLCSVGQKSMARPYKIKKSLFGRYSISYSCPHCGESLSSPIEEGGKADICPNCRRPISVPGAEEAAHILEERRVAEEQAREAAERKKQLKLQEKKERERRERSGLESGGTERRDGDARRYELTPLPPVDAEIVEYDELQDKTPNTRSCPFCGEQILAVAIKCKHCGEFLDGRRPQQAGTQGTQVVVQQAQHPVYIERQGQGGCCLLFIIAAAIVVAALFLALL